ncbi:hypothetical protein B0J11DRAFT_564862 [Dendryphion nanum]|uniref:Zn(2)-C6 fungal-type domain-containing protein n=1 Tax=Dendryphion nanum TaxID=256645 RepID=A0A9P9EBX7_9PLEO|nr:hypothetical protein B0J11DRAFT_564862 [Dendryphion nanum]
MVSRGGRSKGCTNCRRRRVKCVCCYTLPTNSVVPIDETRPICMRCKKRGLESTCEGSRDTTWINEFSGVNSPSPESNDQTVVLPAVVVSSPLSSAAFTDTICLTFTRKYMLRGGPVEMACNSVMTNTLTSTPSIDLLRDAILGLSFTFYGYQHRQAGIMSKGYSQYGVVLRRLNTHLTRPGLQTSHETILTALTCMLLEIFLPTGPDNFFKHLTGIEAILELRGAPSPPYDDETITLLSGIRVLSIVSGLARSKPSLFSRPEWKRIPCKRMGEAGQLRHRIFMILADCTTLMSRRGIVVATEDFAARQALLEDSKLLLTELEEILPDWVAYNEVQMQGPTSKLAKEMRIANQDSALTCMLYYAGYICLIQLIDFIEPSSHYRSLRNSAAVKILKSLQLKISDQSSGGPESNTVTYVATKIAWEALGGIHSPEGRKLARLVRQTASGVSTDAVWQSKVQPVRFAMASANIDDNSQYSSDQESTFEGVMEGWVS